MPSPAARRKGRSDGFFFQAPAGTRQFLPAATGIPKASGNTGPSGVQFGRRDGMLGGQGKANRWAGPGLALHAMLAIERVGE